VRTEIIINSPLQSDDNTVGCWAPTALRDVFLWCSSLTDWNFSTTGPVNHKRNYKFFVFILVQLNVRTIFLKSLFGQHVSDVTAFIFRSTTVVFHSHRFLVSGVFIAGDLYWCWATSSLYHGQFVLVLGHISLYWCWATSSLYHGQFVLVLGPIVTVSRSVCIGVGPHRHCITVSLYWCWATSSLYYGQFVLVLGHIVTVSRSVCIGVGPHRHCITVSLYWCWDTSSL
jgi:hypothetical protein